MSISLLRQLLMKEAVKKSAGSSGIMTINKNIVKDVEKQVQRFINDARAQGVDLDTLSESQIRYIIEMNKPKAPKVYSNEEAAKYLEMFLNQNKKGEVVDLKGKKLDPNKPIIGGTQDDSVTGIMTQVNDRMTGINKANKKLGELLEEKEIMYGKAPKTKDNPKVQEREMFREANEKFNKTDVVADIITKITSMEPIAAMKEANKVIGRKGIYKNLDETQSQKILKDSEDWIFQRDPGDLYDYKNKRPFRDDPNFDPDDPDFDPDQGYYTGGMVDVEPSLSDIGHGSDALMARTRLVSPNSQATTSTGLNYLLAEDNDNIRVPFANGNGVADEDAEKAALGKRVRELMDDGFDFGEAVKQAMSEGYAEGGRIGFAAGGGRRAFLKLLGMFGGATAAAKTGILGLGEGAGKKAVTETVKQSVGSSGTPPPYFFKLVEKIKTMGDDTLASQDKAIAKKYKDYVMEEDFAGNIEIIKKGGDDMYPEDVFISYKVDEVPLKGKKGSTKVEEYEEFTARPDRDGKMKDIEQGVPDEVVEEGTMFEDNMTEFGKADGGRIGFAGGTPSPSILDVIPPDFDDLSTDELMHLIKLLQAGEIPQFADGGRIGFSGGNLAKYLANRTITGSSRKFLEKVFGKERFENMIRNDPEMHRGMLEVVEMFRKKDKEGLKMYLQKFLPHMDDATVEDFIIGSGDTAGIEGQLIRLGSGRDYAGKIEMMKRLERNKALRDLDVTDEMIRKPNAKGGLTTMLGE